MEKSLIDWHQLDLLREECGDAIVEIFREFIAEYPVHRARFSTVLRQRDAKALSKIAHQLKGSSANFGMIGFVATMQRMEIEAEGQTLPTPADMNEMETLFHDSVRLIQAERPDMV